MIISWTVIFFSLVMLVTAEFYHHNQQQQKNQGYERGNVINIFVYRDDLDPSSYVQRVYNWQQDDSRTNRNYNPSIPEYHSSGPYHYQSPQPSYYFHHHHGPAPYHHQYLPPPPPSHSHHHPSRTFPTWSGQTFDGNYYPVPNFDPFCNNHPHSPQIHLHPNIDSSSPATAITTATVEAFPPFSQQPTDVTGIINEVLSSVGAQPSSVTITKGSPSQLPAFVDNQLISGIIGHGTASPNQQQFDRGQPQYIQQTQIRPFPQNLNRPNLEIVTSRPPVPSGLNIGNIVGGVFPGFDQQTRRPAPSRKPTSAAPKPKVEIPRPQIPPSTNINNIIAGIFPGVNTQNYQPIPSRQPTLPNGQTNEISNENQSSPPPPTNINNLIAGVFPTVNQQIVPQEAQSGRPDVNSLINSVFPEVAQQNGSNGKPNALPSIPVFQPDFPSGSKTKPKPDSSLPPPPSVGTITSTSEIPVFQPTIGTQSGSKNGSSNGDDEGPVYDIDIRFGGGDDDANRRKRNMHE